MTRFLRPALIGIAGVSVLAAAGCASRGQIPEIAALQPFNGEWSLATAQPTRRGVQFVSQDGNGFTRETGQKIVAVLGIRAERFVLEVSDSSFQISSNEPGFSFSLPIDGTTIEVPAENGEVEQSMTLTWDHGAPVVRRTLAGAGWVSDRFELTGGGALVVTRTAAMTNNRGMDVGGMGGVEFAYVRSSGSEP